MTPTLAGRWQTRTFLLTYFGLPLTLVFGFLYNNFSTTLILLECVWLLGLLWDVLYHFLQRRRWDRDWPPLFFALGGVAEGVLLWSLIKATFLWQAVGLLAFPGVDPELTLAQFCAHYTTVWLVTFFMMLGPLKVLFLKWRFRGGQFW